jgi:serine/threonine protein kinase
LRLSRAGTAGRDDKLADSIVSDVVAALALAHNLKIIHCDVRPSNIVIVNSEDDASENAAATTTDQPRAMLVDWGVSCTQGAKCAGVGVAAFVADWAFASGSKAHVAQDYVAAAYVWLCIALGEGSAPWLSGALHTVADVQSQRTTWLVQQRESPKVSERARSVIEAALKWSSKSDVSSVEQHAADLFPRRPG